MNDWQMDRCVHAEVSGETTLHAESSKTRIIQVFVKPPEMMTSVASAKVKLVVSSLYYVNINDI